jgi:UDP-2,3-diacylglucosamine pyrophosphatase LpxH
MATVLVWPDCHIPFQHPKALEFLLRAYEKYKCDKVINLGDLFDFSSYSLKWSPDPNGYSPGDEYELLMEELQPFFKHFKDVELIIGNHDGRPWKKVFNAQLPNQLVKSMAEFIHAPKGWAFHQTGFEFQDVWYFHGEGLSQSNWRLAHEKYKQSTVHGHLHNSAGCIFHKDRKKRYFVLNAGSLINEKNYCFRYAQHNFNKAVLGCGVVFDSQSAIFEPMPNKWI